MQIDKDGANPERVKQELSEAGLLPEEWGGKTPMIPVHTIAFTSHAEQLPLVLHTAAQLSVLDLVAIQTTCSLGGPSTLKSLSLSPFHFAQPAIASRPTCSIPKLCHKADHAPGLASPSAQMHPAYPCRSAPRRELEWTTC